MKPDTTSFCGIIIRKEFYMQEFFRSYFNKLDLTTVFENLLTKVISLLILFVLFYIAKQLLHAAVKRIVKPSLKYSKRDAGRQKTISRLLENIFNYTLYFFLVYCILSILGLHCIQFTSWCWDCRGCNWYGSPGLLIRCYQWLLYSL